MGSVTDISGASAYTAEDFALLGYSVGDGGQLLESDLLANMAGIQTRWNDPLVVRYPKYVTRFDFPFSVWMGPETTAPVERTVLMIFSAIFFSTLKFIIGMSFLNTFSILTMEMFFMIGQLRKSSFPVSPETKPVVSTKITSAPQATLYPPSFYPFQMDRE
jgi:hypothetical protein